ncbi:SIR2 family protein [Clostridium beijerinckii]|uniref:SIR2-like domain-containing protein n=1 Tax=Clostridium beijerinckii TaxID=1520 RepID=A0A1S9N6H1_CLOBE|nr:SIR2 family protein [Clostridium beijerinckii]MZK50908.1 hypothetical protein [Clostridium beijerinckii]MZK59110.1 hypothetical protein [Clostridium beijerinckii]MZK69229.1 hypothetical protein [Clostridium beijerinckii]MZK74601.1 hypothetical protein [Clostridium beijerinckii]MZK84321.1 hypothetical protein [Clostridium beijerinckii]
MVKNKYLDEDLKDELVKIIQSCNINFLIGAGFSAGLLKPLGNLEKTIEIIKQNPSNPKNIVLESYMYWKFFEESMYPICDEVNKENLKYQIEFFKLWLDILNERQSSILPKQINVFTTNYDIILEFSMENKFIDYNDGFSGRINPYFVTSNYNKLFYKQALFTNRKSEIPIFNIFKIHGSLTWGTDSHNRDKIIYQDYRKVLKGFFDYNNGLFTKSSEKDNIGSVISVYEKISKCSWDDLNKDFLDNAIADIKYTNEELKDKYIPFIERYKDTFKIVNPTKAKFCDTIVNKNYYELIRIYCNEIEKENCILFVLGFSFNDEHIEDITKRSLNNASLIIIIFAYSKRDRDNFNEKFEQFNNVMIVGLSEWDKDTLDGSVYIDDTKTKEDGKVKEEEETKEEVAVTISKEKTEESNLGIEKLNEFLINVLKGDR